MVPFASSLRHLLGRSQAQPTSAPDSIARYDGMSDGELYSQQIRDEALQHYDNDPANRSRLQSPMAEQTQLYSNKHGSQPSLPQYGQQSQQFAASQNGRDQSDVYGSGQIPQESGNSGRDQYEGTLQQLRSRTATAQPSHMSPTSVRPNEHDQALHFSDANANAGTEVQVKTKPSAEVGSDRDLFAEFTNEDAYIDDSRNAANHWQIVNETPQVATQASLHTLPTVEEPASEVQLPRDTLERTEGVDAAAASSHAAMEASAITPAQISQLFTVDTSRLASETDVTASGLPSATTQPQGPDARNTAIHGDTSSSQFHRSASIDAPQGDFSYETRTKDAQRAGVDARSGVNDGNSQRSPSADSVLGSECHSSEDTAISLSGIDLAARARQLAWSERHKFSDTGTLAAQAVQENPRLLHGSTAVQQYGHNAINLPPGIYGHQQMMNQPSRALEACSYSNANGPQRSSTFPHVANLNYAPLPVSGQNDQSQFWRSRISMQQLALPGYQYTPMYPTQGLVGPQRIAEVQEEEHSEASDDDEPLVTRASRHRSATAEATVFPAAHEQAGSKVDTKPVKDALRSSASGVKANSVIELSDDDTDKAESIDWKLPPYEATYYPPAKPEDGHMAKVSIPGKPRAEVALTEDHNQQEMQLFLDLFLPVQRALAQPDPEPAHAIINFHTISVMVLEAFAHYECGDEMGRGYGFFGGNEARRPSPSSSDGELPRTRSAKDADVDEIFFAVIDRWRAGLALGKETMKLIRGCQEFCDIALDVIHYVKDHGLLQPEPRKRKERSDKGVTRGPRGANAGETASPKPKTAVKRKADAVEKAPAKKGAKAKTNELQARKKTKVEEKKKPKSKSKPGVTVFNSKKK